ncbi:hypothetical protein [Streptomyces sp. 150FB]|uniref:hypothetical protein n=1 Tax=Streptomyces sp. 150FB TaxID=1576605 RepID=UPI001364BCEF|nr:hypothetical protein [Streptomyces sp. 150FB]
MTRGEGAEVLAERARVEVDRRPADPATRDGRRTALTLRQRSRDLDRSMAR